MNTTESSAGNPTTAEQLAQIRGLLQQGKFTEVLAAAQALSAREPAQRDARLFAAFALRNLGRVDEALAGLAELERREPRFARLYEERGRCYVAMRQAQPAIDAFLAAVNRNNALPEAGGCSRACTAWAGMRRTRASPPATSRR